MSGTNTWFTDSNLKLFYGNLLRHYKECSYRENPKLNLTELYTELLRATQYATESPNGTFYHLKRSEKDKVYQAFKVLFYALPSWRKSSAKEKNSFNPQAPSFSIESVYVISSYNNYNCYDSALYDWILLSVLTNQSYKRDSITGLATSDNQSGKIITALAFRALLATAAIASFIVLFYMVHQFINSVERLYYNEGWLKAVLMLASSVAFGSLSTVLSLTLTAFPLAALATFVGFNPVLLIATGAIALTLIGASIGCYTMSFLYDFFEDKSNKDAIDSGDPKRFRLTTSEEHYLIQKNIDPIAVRCAIVALRAEISRILESEKPIPSFLERQFGRGKEIQKLLDQVRGLRNGEITEVSIGELVFHCKTRLKFVDTKVCEPSEKVSQFSFSV